MKRETGRITATATDISDLYLPENKATTWKHFNGCIRAIRMDGEEKNSGKFKINETPESS